MPKILKLVIPLGIVAAGGLIAFILVATKVEASRSEAVVTATPVETLVAIAGDHSVKIDAQGTVIPARSIMLEAEIAGRVVRVNPKLRPGAKFRAGELILKIDDRDFLLALEQQQAVVEQASVALALERGRKSVAEREWQILASEIDSGEEGRALALREPQLRQAEVTLEAARSGLKRSELNLARTTLRAPFPCVVQYRNVDVGQVVRPGAPLARLVGTAVFWIEVAVPVADLPWIEIPGAAAYVLSGMGENRTKIRQGTVVELLSDVEPAGLMARLLVEIADPLETDETAPLPLLVGSSVAVEIAGSTAKDVFKLPGSALRTSDVIWLATESGTLSMTQGKLVWRMRDSVLVNADIAAGAQIITSTLSTPVQGMKVMVR